MNSSGVLNRPKVETSVPRSRRVLTQARQKAVWSTLWRGQLALFGLLVSIGSARLLPASESSIISLLFGIVGVFSCLDGGLVLAFASELDPSNGEQMAKEALSMAKRILVKRLTPAVAVGIAIAALCVTLGLDQRLVAVVFAQLCVVLLSMVLAPWERVGQMSRRYRELAITTFFGLALPTGFVVLLISKTVQSTFAWWAILSLSAPLYPRIALALTSLSSIRKSDGRNASGKQNSDQKPTQVAAKTYANAKEFLLLQVVSVVAFSTDVLVAKSLSLNEAAVQLALIARLFGPAALIVGIAIQDVWPRVAQAKASSLNAAIEEGAKSVRKITYLSAILAFICIPIPLFANSILPAYADLSPVAVISAALWFALVNSGSAAGQVVVALGRQRENLKRNISMAIANLVGSILLGVRFGAPGFLLSSLLAYGLILYRPTLRIIR
jgi:uncharacterized membrane protein YphA (DoxX/SURF4 family)